MNDPRDEPTTADYAMAAAEKALKQGPKGAHNAALRSAQRLIRQQAKTFRPVEQGYQNYGPDPRARAYNEAADLIEALIEPEES